MRIPDIDMGQAVAELQVEVHIKKSAAFGVRLWIGLQLIKLGAWIAGFGGTSVTGEAQLDANATR